MTQHPHERGEYPQDQRRPYPSRPQGEDSGLSTIIPYTNPKALVAYYCGVFGLIPVLGFILGPVALIFGILALNYVRRNPTAKGTAHAIVGIVLGTLSTMGHLLLLILIFAGVLLAR
jgi:hypothetical protein